MTYFDSNAKGWDKRSMNVDRAQTTFDEIKKWIPVKASDNILEFGCGTGLLGLHFRNIVNRVDMYDNSMGMRTVLTKKILELGAENIRLVGPETGTPVIPGNYNLIVTLMVLHHIVDTDTQITSFADLLLPGGYVCIADLVKEDGSFHAHISGYNGHNGFGPAELADVCRKHGLSICHMVNYYRVHKSGKEYPLFLLVLRKDSGNHE